MRGLLVEVLLGPGKCLLVSLGWHGGRVKKVLGPVTCQVAKF